ncbi:MAG: choice-of-anchor D domain-containing protein [Chloroflexota bacterium]
MAGRPGRQVRPFALVTAAGLAVVVAGSALAGPAPPTPARPAAPEALPAGSRETPGSTELVSTPQVPGGAQGATPAGAINDIFAAPTISADGRYVVFLQVVGGGRGNQVMLRDRQTQTTTALDEASGSELLRQPAISADGRWVAYVRPLDGTRTVVLVEVASGTRTVAPRPPGRNLNPDQPALSRDGRFLAVRTAFLKGSEILVLDRTSAAWETVSVDVNGVPTGSSGALAAQPAISWDGRFVVFTAAATSARLTVTPKPSNEYRQVYLRDRQAGTTTLLSIGPAGTQGRGHSLTPAISGSGAVVAFASAADDLVADDGNQQVDVFAWSSSTGGLEIVSRSTAGAAGDAGSGYPAVSGDGSQVAFASAATTLVPGDTTAGPVSSPGLAAYVPFAISGDVFVRDRGAPRTTRISVGRDNASEANGFSTYPSISSSGRFVAFTSAADNLIAREANKANDVFVRDRPPRVEAGPDPLDFGSAPLGSLGTTRAATIRSTGITPARIGAISIGGANASDFVVAANPCSDRTLVPGAMCELGVLFIGTAKGERAATLQVANDAGEPVVLRLVGAVGIPKLAVEPQSGPPGLVVIATGTGFPPNAPVSLRWSVGISATPLVPVVSDATGSFTAQVLIVPRDRVGRRNLRAVASVPGLTVDPVIVRFLVVTATAGPPISGLVQVFAATPGEPIILRR